MLFADRGTLMYGEWMKRDHANTEKHAITPQNGK